ncbi:hypothetical protein A7K61_09685 [Pseudomonas sp. AP42]|nr:hypothetical protein A7K61_09685 [Pseudomonas sp. AP42]
MDNSWRRTYRDKKGPVSSLSSGFRQRLALALTDIACAFDLANDQINTSIDLGPGHLAQLF